MRILVADDNQTDRLLLSTIVAREGHEVVTAVDGLDALEKFESSQPELVLLDALMPGLDGFEVARRIKERLGEDFVPVIFLTSFTEADQLARCLDAGGDDFLSKPYNRLILKSKICAFQRMRRMHTTVQEQRDQIGAHNSHLVQEQEAARAIFDRVAHSGCLGADNIRHMISPLAVFNGDVLLAARNPGGGMYLLLGDFTGHGLTAGIGAMPLADVFYSMTQKGFKPGDILRQCNYKLNMVLPPGTFCCASMVDFNFGKGVIEVWNGGLPDGLIYRPGDPGFERIVSRNLPLGVLSPERFQLNTQVFDLPPGGRVLLHTDGVPEATDVDGRMFGSERLERIVGGGGRADEVFDRVRAELVTFLGSGDHSDDITMVEVGMVREHEFSAPSLTYQTSGQVGPRDWTLAYQLGPASLRVFNPLPLLQHILMEVPALRDRGRAIYMVLAELFSNALEHGVLGLDSALKRSADGFADYYRRRAAALDAITSGFVRFELESDAGDDAGFLKIRVRDSGRGFDHVTTRARKCGTASRNYHGRGLPLLESLCHSLTYKGAGNEVEAVFVWSSDDAVAS